MKATRLETRQMAWLSAVQGWQVTMHADEIRHAMADMRTAISGRDHRKYDLRAVTAAAYLACLWQIDPVDIGVNDPWALELYEEGQQ